MKTINKDVKANTKSATNPFTNTGARGNNASVHLKLTLGADASAYEVCPPQVKKICNILFELGGTATLGQVNTFAETSTGDAFWGYDDGRSYEQTPSKIMNTYLAKTLGDKEWSKKAGKLEIFRKVK